MGLTLTWLSIIILIPLAGLFLKTFDLSLDQFWGIVTSRRTLNALKISFGLSFAAALVNLVMGMIVVWALVRYRFPGRRLFDAIVDIPFALPTAVAGIALTQLFAQAVGEYGSVIFIAGNLPNVSEIAPLLIVIRLSEFRYADATAIAVVMLVASFLIIFAVNRLQRWAQTRIPAH